MLQVDFIFSPIFPVLSGPSDLSAVSEVDKVYTDVSKYCSSGELSRPTPGNPGEMEWLGAGRKVGHEFERRELTALERLSLEKRL
jgi:hypothetical protein